MLLGEKLRSSKTFVDEPPVSYNWYMDSIVHVALPGRVSIGYGWTDDDNWQLQVGYIDQDGTRRVVCRTFMVNEDGELDFEIRSWVEEPQQVEAESEQIY